MYVYKMVFTDEEDIKEDVFGYKVIYHTDYGTQEILASDIQDRIKALKENPEKFDYTLEEFEKDMKDSFGEAYEMLVKDEIDFILIS